MEVGEEEDYIHLAYIATPSPPEWLLHKMGSGERQVSLTVRDKITRRCPRTTTFLKIKEIRSGMELSFCLPA